MLNGLRILTLTLVATVLACIYDGGTSAGASPLRPGAAVNMAALTDTAGTAEFIDYRYYRNRHSYGGQGYYGRNDFFGGNQRFFGGNQRFFGGNQRFFGDNRRFNGGPRYVRPRYDNYGSYGGSYGRPYGYDRPRWRPWYDNRW